MASNVNSKNVNEESYFQKKERETLAKLAKSRPIVPGKKHSDKTEKKEEKAA